MKQGLIKETTRGAVPLNLNLRIFGLFGLVLVILYAFLGRGLYFKPELLTGLIMLSVVFIFSLLDMALRGEADYFRYPLDYLVTALAVAYLLVVLVSVSKPDAVLGALKGLGYLMAFFITAQVIRTWKSYHGFMEALFAGSIMVALVGLLSASGHLNYPGAYNNNAILSTFQYPNALANFLVITSIIGLSLWAGSDRSPLRDLWYLEGLLLLNVTLLGTKSRAVWMMFPVLLLIWLMGLPKEKRSKVFLRITYILIASILINRGFFARVTTGQGEAALLILLGGSLMALAGWLIIHRVNRLIKRKPMGPAVKKFWQGVGIGYMVIVLGIYAFYAVKTLPGGWDTLVHQEITRELDSVHAYDSSFQSRFRFYEDAVQIIKDYPLTGTGAGGWNALYRQYQSQPYNTADVHNNFLQVAVETGVIGLLLYTSIWIVCLYSAYRLYRHFRKDHRWPLVWGVLIGLLAMLLHSSFDFDLSIPALALFTWILFALVRNSRKLAHRNGHGGENTTGKLARWVPVVLGLGLALGVIIPAARLYSAGVIGAEGAQAMAAGKIDLAQEKLSRAAEKDPYTGSYLADLARIELVYWLKDADAERLREGVAKARLALEKEPHNLQLQTNLITAYLMAGMKTEAVKETERLVEANPFEIKAYEVTASANMDAALYFRQQKETATAGIHIARVIRIVSELEKRREEVAVASGKAYKYTNFLKPTPRLNLHLGQANLLAERPDEGIPFLELAVRNDQVGKEAAAWLAVAYRKTGDTKNFNKLMKTWREKDTTFQSLYDQVEKII